MCLSLERLQIKTKNEIHRIGLSATVGNPEDVKLEEDKPLEFAVEVEVMPTFDLPDFDSIKLQRPMIEVEDSHVAEEVERQKIRHGNLEDVDGETKEGDSLVGPASVILNDGDDAFF